MSSFTIGKVVNTGLGPSVDKPSRQAGMQGAGVFINDWLKEIPENDVDDFFDDVFAYVKTTEFKVIYFGEGGVPYVVTKSGKRYRFKDGNNVVHKIRICMQEDVEDTKKNFRMTITLPRDRANELASGYVTEIVDDLSNIPAPADQAKYLLATIFLSRCH